MPQDEVSQQGNADVSDDIANLPEIRRIQDASGAWYYNVTDVIAALTGTTDASDYWVKMKRRGKSEGFEATLQKIVQFPMRSRKDGKLRSADCADRETLLRLVQSIPSASPRLEKLKLWLAQVGEERLQESEVNAQIEEVRQKYRALGRDDAWIEDRILNLTGRNALTDQWQKRGAVQKLHFGLLTTILHRGAFGITPDEHREVKGLPKRENPREHMDRVELALSTLTEATATASHIENDSQGIDELKSDVLKAAEPVRLHDLPPRKPSGAQLSPRQIFWRRPNGNGGNSSRYRNNQHSSSKPSQIRSRPTPRKETQIHAAAPPNDNQCQQSPHHRGRVLAGTR